MVQPLFIWIQPQGRVDVCLETNVTEPLICHIRHPLQWGEHMPRSPQC